MRQLMSEIEALVLNIGMKRNDNHFDRRVVRTLDMTGQPIDAFGKIRFYNPESLVFKQRGHAQDRIYPEIPLFSNLTRLGFYGPLVRNPVHAQSVEGVVGWMQI